MCTANTLNIPPPLLDRMEVIRLPGYTEDEKMNIARRYLVPKQMKSNGLKPDELKVSDGALLDIVRYYTREAGVRNLEREIAKIGRKAVKQMLLHKKEQKSVAVTPRNLDKFLGVRRFRYGKAEDMNRVGQVTGLAWTEVGGELLTIEAAVVPGKGKLQHTGQLGEVMQESIQAAMTVVRSRCAGARARRLSSIRSTTCTCTSRKGRRRRTARAPASACAPRWSRRSPRSRCARTWR